MGPNSTKNPTRYFVNADIPQARFPEVTFSYNYFTVDETENETGESFYDNKEFRRKSYQKDSSGAFVLDDNGNKLIIDGEGHVIAKDSDLVRRTPRHNTIVWSPPTVYTTLTAGSSYLNGSGAPPRIEDLYDGEMLCFEETITSIYDSSIKVFDPTLSQRLSRKVEMLAKLKWYNNGMPHPWALGHGEMAMNANFVVEKLGIDKLQDSWLGSDLKDYQAIALDLLDLNKPESAKRVNELGDIEEPKIFQEAQAFLLEMNWDRRLIGPGASSNTRVFTEIRTVSNYFDSIDQDSRSKLPRERDLTDNSLYSTDDIEDELAGETPEIPAYQINDQPSYQAVNADNYLIGYIVERYTGNMSTDQDQSEKVFFLDGYNNTTLIDTEIAYGRHYYYTIRTVWMREGTVYAALEQGEEPDLVDVRQFFVSKASDPVYVETVEVTPPTSPDGIRYNFNYQDDSLIIDWQYPPARTRDTKYFQIFRRDSINKPFTCIAELDFNDAVSPMEKREKVNYENVLKFANPQTQYVDPEFKRNSSFIYAIASVDAHGLTSPYSSQTRVSFDSSKNRINIKHVSPAGAPKQYPNFFVSPDEDENISIRTLTQDVIATSGREKVTVYFDNEAVNYSSEKSGEIKHVHFRNTDSGEPVYKLHFINLDRQKDDAIEIRINDLRAVPE